MSILLYHGIVLRYFLKVSSPTLSSLCSDTRGGRGWPVTSTTPRRTSSAPSSTWGRRWRSRGRSTSSTTRSGRTKWFLNLAICCGTKVPGTPCLQFRHFRRPIPGVGVNQNWNWLISTISCIFLDYSLPQGPVSMSWHFSSPSTD